MRIEFFILSVIVVLVSGCVSYRAGNLKEITANELEKPPQSTCSYFAGPGAGWLKDVAQGLGAFGTCREEGGAERELVPGEIRITYAGRGRMDDMKDDDDTWVAVSAASLFLIPARQEFRGECRYTVEDWQGKKASYVFADSTVHWFGLLVVFAMPFYEETDSLQLGLDIQRAALGNLAVAMRRDGFFSADKAAAAKTDVVEAAKKTVAARRKELEDLKKAGIITEEEFAAEVKKLARNDGRWCEYVVKAGDTMRSIADAHRVDIRKLKTMNGLTSDILHVGQILRVPTNATGGCAGR